jgi:hypothetical protein
MQRMMQAAAITLSLAMTFGTSPTAGENQKSAPPVSLTRALADFSAADADHDGRISLQEARAIPVTAEAFRSEDENGDGFWSRDEFLVFYHRQLSASGQRAEADLEAEIARLQALKRVRAVERTNRLTAETSARCANAASVNERFESALADLEKKCSARKATRDDFQRLRNLVILNGRIAERTGPQSALLETLDRIERSSALGQPTQESFKSLREIAGTDHEAGRAAIPEAARTPPQPAAPPAAVKAAPSTPPAGPAAGPADARQKAQPKIEPRTERPSPPPPPAKKPSDKDKADRSPP